MCYNKAMFSRNSPMKRPKNGVFTALEHVKHTKIRENPILQHLVNQFVNNSVITML